MGSSHQALGETTGSAATASSRHWLSVLGTHTRRGRLRLVVGVQGAVRNVGEALEGTSADQAVQLGARDHWRQGRGDDILLGQHALDDAGRATNGLKEARVRRDDVERWRDRKVALVRHLEIELEGEVSYQTGTLARLEGNVLRWLQH